MTLFRLTWAIFILCISPQCFGVGTSADDLAKLKGRWTPISEIHDGNEAKPEQLASLTILFDADRMTFNDDGNRQCFRITLDSSSSPAQLEMTLVTVITAAPVQDAKTIHGIYAFEGQTLKLAWALKGNPRPTSFKIVAGEKVNVMVLKRAAILPQAVAPADAQTRKQLGIVLLNVLEYSSDQSGSPVRTLLSLGADPSVCSGQKGLAPLHGLAENAGLWDPQHFDEWQDAATALLSAGAEINQKTDGAKATKATALHILAEAATKAQKEPESARFVLNAAEFLVQHGADPSIADANGAKPRDLLSELKESQFKKDLLAVFSKERAPVKAVKPTRPGLEDVHAVALDLNQCAFNVIEFPPDDAAVLLDCLLKVGADPHDGIGLGESLLAALAYNSGTTWYASENDWRRAAAALIKAGANVNNQRGSTPLDDAIAVADLNAQYDHPADNEMGMIKLLIENGADPTLKDKQGKTARDRAAAITDKKVSRRLLDLMDNKGK